MGRVVVVFSLRGVTDSKVTEDDIGSEISDQWVYGPGGPVHGVHWSEKRSEVAVIPSSFRVSLSELLDMDRVIGEAIEDATGGTVDELEVTATPEVPYVDAPEVEGFDEMSPDLADSLLDVIYETPGPVPDELRDALWDAKERGDGDRE